MSRTTWFTLSLLAAALVLVVHALTRAVAVLALRSSPVALDLLHTWVTWIA